MKSLQNFLSAIKTLITIAAVYAAYSLIAAFDYHVPTLQEVLAAKTFSLSKARPTAQFPQITASAAICELAKKGYMVTAADGALELCITSGAK